MTEISIPQPESQEKTNVSLSKQFEQGLIDHLRQQHTGPEAFILSKIEGQVPDEGNPEHQDFVEGFEKAKELARAYEENNEVPWPDYEDFMRNYDNLVGKNETDPE